MNKLDAERVREYFAESDEVTRWWEPESGPMSFHYAAELRVIEDKLVIDPAWRVLDLGTGRGRFGLHFASEGCSVVGIDVNPAMRSLARDAARERGLDRHFEVRAGDAHELREFEDASFDVVVCMETFDHLPGLGVVVDEIRRVLIPGGLLIFSFVPGASFYGALGNLVRMFYRHAGSGERILSQTYSVSELRRCLGERGIQLEHCYGIGLLCLNAQTRLAAQSRFMGVLRSLARAEASVRPYIETSWLAGHAAHVVAFARRDDGASGR